MKYSNQLIRSLLIAALVLLPFSHLRWLPDFGTTRPASSVLFVLILGLIILVETIQFIRQNGFHLRELFRSEFFRDRLLPFDFWQILLPWVILILLGIGSAALTPFYGNFLQALNRLLGYGIIFATLYSGLYARKIFSMQQIATWISLGYLPVLAYGTIEAIATQKISWAVQVVKLVRSWIVVDFDWASRISYFATEPSFVGFQLLLLIAILPFLKSRVLRLTNIAILLIAVVFSKSGNILLDVGAYLAFVVFFYLSFRLRVWLLAIGAILTGSAGIWYAFFTPFQLNLDGIRNLSVALKMPRLYFMVVSSMIRNAHIMNLVYALIDTRGVGLGIGQYGQFWKEIFLRHMDPNVVDPSGEILLSMASPAYGRPWSVILGIGADLGILGMLLLFAFFYKVWRSFQGPHSRSIFMAGLIALFGAYPIVTPHVWLAFALLAGAAIPGRGEKAAL